MIGQTNFPINTFYRQYQELPFGSITVIEMKVPSTKMKLSLSQPGS